MKEQISIRSATVADAAGILEIYRYYVEHTAISFEYDVPTLEEFERRIAATLDGGFPYLVSVKDGEICGYSYAGPFIRRAAYDWSAELTIYLRTDCKKQGIGRMLYEEMERLLQKKGIRNLYACIGLPEVEDEYLNKNSAQFHEHMGFSLVGVFHKCGCKFNRWYHMVWMEKLIGEHGEEVYSYGENE